MARSHLIIFVLLTAFALTGQAAPAQEPPAGPTMPAPAAPPEVFGERMLAYLLAHPEVIVEAVQIYRQRQEAARAETAKGVIADRADEIFRDPAAPSAGKAAGNVTPPVGLFNYNRRCCRAVASMVNEILGGPSAAAGLQGVPDPPPRLRGRPRGSRGTPAGQDQEIHEALMAAQASVTEERELQAAAAAGLDPEQWRRDMADPAIDQAIARRSTRRQRHAGLRRRPSDA